MTEPVIIGSARLYCADARDILPRLAGIHSIVTDPPYGQSNEDYDGPAATSLDPAFWRMTYQAAAESACVVSFAGSPTYHRIASAIESGGWKIKQMWGWAYGDGMIISAYPKEGFDRLAPALDPIAFATKGKVLLPLRREGNHVWKRPNVSRGVMNYSDRSSGHGTEESAGQWPRCVFYQARTSGGTGHIQHPNAKPENLMTWLVDKVPGTPVLDPFMGSGTTGIAVVKAGRAFIGVEQNPRHFDLACRRIDEAQKQLRLF